MLWHLGVNAFVLKLTSRRSQAVAWWHFTAFFMLPSLLLVYMQTWWLAAYVRHRIPLLFALRVVREVSIVFIFLPFQNELWPVVDHPPGTSCRQIIVLPQAVKVFYLFSRIVAYPLPLVHTIWMVAESTLIMVMQVPQRCAMDMGGSPVAGACAVGWATSLDAASSFWTFSAGRQPFGSRPLEPWEACTVVQATLMLVAGALVPLLLCASLEERWRHEWLCLHGRGFLAPSMLTRLLFDAALAVLGTAISYHLVSTLIEGPLVPAAAELWGTLTATIF